MKLKQVIFFLSIIFLTGNSIKASSKVLLRLSLQKGTNYEMTMNVTSVIDQEMMGQKMKIDQNMEYVFNYLVLDELPNQNYLIEYSLVRYKMNVKVNGQDVNLDSENTDASNPLNGILNSLTKTKLKLEINPRGQAEKVEGIDELAKKIAGNQQLAQSMQMFTDEVNFLSFISQTFNYFTDNAIEKGNKWNTTYKLPSMMNMETTLNFEVADMDKHQINLNILSDINMEGPAEQAGYKFDMKATGNQTGSMIVDLKDGWFRSSDLTQVLDVHLKMKNPQSGEDMQIPMKVNSITKTTVIKK